MALVLDNPLENPEDFFGICLFWTNNVLTLVFLAEFIIKSVTHGLIMIPGAYLRDSWNLLDFFIVIISVISALTSFNGTSGTGSLAALKSFYYYYYYYYYY